MYAFSQAINSGVKIMDLPDGPKKDEEAEVVQLDDVQATLVL